MALFDPKAKLPQALQERLDSWLDHPPGRQHQAYGPLNAYLQVHKFPSDRFLTKPQKLLRRAYKVPKEDSDMDYDPEESERDEDEAVVSDGDADADDTDQSFIFQANVIHGAAINAPIIAQMGDEAENTAPVGPRRSGRTIKSSPAILDEDMDADDADGEDEDMDADGEDEDMDADGEDEDMIMESAVQSSHGNKPDPNASDSDADNADESFDSNGIAVSNQNPFYPDFTVDRYWGSYHDADTPKDVIRVVIEVASLRRLRAFDKYKDPERKKYAKKAFRASVTAQLHGYLKRVASRCEKSVLGVIVLGNEVQLLEITDGALVFVDGNEPTWISLFDDQFVHHLNRMRDIDVVQQVQEI